MKFFAFLAALAVAYARRSNHRNLLLTLRDRANPLGAPRIHSSSSERFAEVAPPPDADRIIAGAESNVASSTTVGFDYAKRTTRGVNLGGVSGV